MVLPAKKKPSSPVQAADVAKKDDPQDNNKEKWLLVPPNPIDGGNDIAVGFRIKQDMLTKPAGTELTATIELKWQKDGSKKEEPIATFVLSNNVLAVVKKGELHVSTRIKIAFNSKEQMVTGALAATLTLVDSAPMSQVAKLQVMRSDNLSMNNGQLVLQVQSVKSESKDLDVILATSLVPRPQLTANSLSKISGAVRNPDDNASINVIEMTVSDPKLLSEEVFLAFNFIPKRPQKLAMSWSYGEGRLESIGATAYLPEQKKT
jgi:hypothetical protein